MALSTLRRMISWLVFPALIVLALLIISDTFGLLDAQRTSFATQSIQDAVLINLLPAGFETQFSAPTFSMAQALAAQTVIAEVVLPLMDALFFAVLGCCAAVGVWLLHAWFLARPSTPDHARRSLWLFLMLGVFSVGHAAAWVFAEIGGALPEGITAMAFGVIAGGVAGAAGLVFWLGVLLTSPSLTRPSVPLAGVLAWLIGR